MNYVCYSQTREAREKSAVSAAATDTFLLVESFSMATAKTVRR